MFQVIWTYDGCPDDNASPAYATVDECKAFIQNRMELTPNLFRNNPKLGLDIIDLSTGRLISYVL